jgi:hypothetical protein
MYEIYLFVGCLPAAAQALAAKHNVSSSATTDRVRMVAMPSPFSLSSAAVTVVRVSE